MPAGRNTAGSSQRVPDSLGCGRVKRKIGGGASGVLPAQRAEMDKRGSCSYRSPPRRQIVDRVSAR